MDLSLDKEQGTAEAFHNASGSKFVIKALSIARYNALLKKNTKNGELDAIAFKSALANEIIVSWSENIKGECTEENKIKFGAKFASEIMPDLIEKALELGTGIVEGVEAAKNV